MRNVKDQNICKIQTRLGQ